MNDKRITTNTRKLEKLKSNIRIRIALSRAFVYVFIKVRSAVNQFGIPRRAVPLRFNKFGLVWTNLKMATPHFMNQFRENLNGLNKFGKVWTAVNRK